MNAARIILPPILLIAQTDKAADMDFSRIRTFSIKNRTHKVKRSMLGSVPADGGFAAFYDSLPDILGARDLKAVAKAIATARLKKREVILAMGAHPIKCGLSPLIVNLVRKGVLTCIALNGAGAIHDFEMAFIGQTSEDVAETLQDGSFGMVEETGSILNTALKEGVADNLGAGASIGRHIASLPYDCKDISILAAGYEAGVDVTVHIAIGTDTIHVHPDADGAVIGKATHSDLMRLTDHIAKLEGGVFINLGSAVILPEVFLKALSAVRNMGYDVTTFTTVNMDMIRQYRPSENVLKRPSLTGAAAFHITGQHELMLPLLTAAVELETERL